MRGLFLLLIGVLVLGGPFAFSDETRETFSLANQRYAEGRYEEAVSLYETLIEGGAASAPLYYNLGNTYFKLGRIGKAILNYERARRLSPQEEGLLANLSYVKNLVEQAQPVEEHRILERAFLTLRDSLSATGWTLCLSVCYNVLFLILLLAIFFQGVRKRVVFWTWILAIVTAGSALMASTKISAEVSVKEGIVIQQVAEIRYSPSEKGAVAFQLKEGIRTQILRCDGDWCYIRLTGDKIGWVARPAIEEI